MAEHDLLTQMLDRLEDMLAPSRPAVAETHYLRGEFARLFSAHLAHEESVIYPRLLASNHIAAADTARQFAQELEVLAADWYAHVELWTFDVMQSFWSGYCDACRTMIARLRTRFAQENGELYPTALAAAVITLRTPGSVVGFRAAA